MLGYCFSGASEMLSLKVVIVKTNGNRKLMLFYLIFWRGGVQLHVLFASLVNKSTMLNCRGVELYIRVERIFKMGRSKKKNYIVELWKFSLKMGDC